jgi:hypothetical protein
MQVGTAQQARRADHLHAGPESTCYHRKGGECPPCKRSSEWGLTASAHVWRWPDARQQDQERNTMSGRPYLPIPGATNVPDRVLRVVSRVRIDHPRPEFAALTHSTVLTLRNVFGSGR